MGRTELRRERLRVPGVMLHTCRASTSEAEVEGLLGMESQCGLYNGCQASQDYEAKMLSRKKRVCGEGRGLLVRVQIEARTLGHKGIGLWAIGGTFWQRN